MSNLSQNSNDLDYMILSEFFEEQEKLWQDIKKYCREDWKIVELLIMAQKGKPDKIFCVLQRILKK